MNGADDPLRLMRFVLDMRQAGVTDAAALSAMERTPRGQYAPAHLAGLALDDTNLPLPHGQVMTKPSLIGRMLSALQVEAEHRVLEIGTGSGYQAACIAQRAKRVVSVERWRDLMTEARARLGAARLMHVTVHHGDGVEGHEASAPYDRIIVNGAMPDLPLALRDQLAPGGAILAPLGLGAEQRLIRFSAGARVDLGPVRFAPLELGLPPESD